MQVPKNLLETADYSGDGYKPVIDFEKWRVALLNSLDGSPPEKIDEMEKHNETDEVFVLLNGRAILFLNEENDGGASMHAVEMEPSKIYNVKKSVWHTVVKTKGTKILIVENSDTATHNSSYRKLSEEERKIIIDLTKKLWQK
jgi:ureidoglycolate hydrolase